MKALIFDMDGLMIDSERLYFQTEKELARKYGREVKEETLWRMMGRNPLESLEIYIRETGIPLSAPEALEIRNILMREKLRDELDAMPGLFHILGTFHGRLKLAVCTGAQGEFLDIVVDRLNIRDKFDVLQHSDNVKSGKPNPEIYLTACRKLDLKPEKCIVLEDSSNGSLAGKRAGCYVIAIPSEYTRKQNFEFVDYIAADLFDAEQHITSTLLSNAPSDPA